MQWKRFFICHTHTDTNSQCKHLSIDSEESISHALQVKYIEKLLWLAQKWNACSEKHNVIGMEAKPDIIYELIAYANSTTTPLAQTYIFNARELYKSYGSCCYLAFHSSSFDLSCTITIWPFPCGNRVYVPDGLVPFINESMYFIWWRRWKRFLEICYLWWNKFVLLVCLCSHSKWWQGIHLLVCVFVCICECVCAIFRIRGAFSTIASHSLLSFWFCSALNSFAFD